MSEKHPSNEIVQAFMCTDRIHRSAVEQQLSVLGIHRSQHMMLMFLAHCDEVPSQAEMARRFEISPAAVTVTLQKLEKAGLVERTMRNGREKEIAVSEAGREIVERTKQMFSEIDEVMCEGISDEELDAFMHVQERMQKNMRDFLSAKEKETES